MELYNKKSKEELLKELYAEPFKRTTVSFYRYVIIENPEEFRNQLFQEWSELNVFGRVYIAREGINAQISLPEEQFEAFKQSLYSHPEFKDVPFKIAVDDDGKSFYKLMIKVRKKIVADGLDDGSFDVTNVGNHLHASEFHRYIGEENTIVIDMRNHYEYEIGHFSGAINLDVDTFREALPKAVEEFKDQKNKKILLYCTGGIRCEKASAYMKHHGFEDVNQLLGGIIDYGHMVKQEEKESKYIGKNFVFDDRLGERITDDVISVCHQCGEACDTHTNCANDACHLLFIQCERCATQYDGCCTVSCQEFIKLPEEEQIKQRKGKPAKGTHKSYHKGRVRPKLIDILKTKE